MDVTLAWDPNAEEDLGGYRIYAREESEAYNYSQPEWAGMDTQCIVQGFDEYESYYFVVRAVDAEGNESGDSNEVYLPADFENDSSSGNSGGGGGGGCFITTVIAD